MKRTASTSRKVSIHHLDDVSVSLPLFFLSLSLSSLSHLVSPPSSFAFSVSHLSFPYPHENHAKRIPFRFDVETF